MSDHSPLTTPSNNLKKAITWLAETVQDHPQRSRKDVLRAAELRFDLTPLECNFLDKNFCEVTKQQARDYT
jgi:hypothetical protein